MRVPVLTLVAALLAAPAAAQPDAIVPVQGSGAERGPDDLKQRLAQTRFPDELSGAGWNYGTDLAYLRQLTAYWRDRYDWRAQERRLNELPQFKTQDRRPRHPLRALAIACAKRDADCHDPRLAGIVSRVREDQRSAGESRRPRRHATPTRFTWWPCRCQATGSRTSRASRAFRPSGWAPSSPR